MILKALYDYYQRKGDLAPIGFQEVEIHYVIIISPEGDFVKIENRRYSIAIFFIISSY